MIKPPDYIEAIKPYVPGKPIEELERELGIKKSIKLASNENPAGPSPAALEILKDSMRDIHRYPDGSGYYLKKELSVMLSVRENELILGNGSNELIEMAARTYMKQGDEAVMAAPSFVVYAMAAQAVGAKPVQVPLKDYTHDLDAMAAAITPKTKMIFIANPNNPTGTINRASDFEKLMKNISGDILVVADEAYFEYVSDTDYPATLEYFRSGKNILILRTFSKIYGLAGLRIGYGIANKEIVTAMNRVRAPFNTSAPAQRAALAALGDRGHLTYSKDINETGKKFLYGELKSMGIKYVPTEANFIYILVDNAASIYEKLLGLGIIIRPIGQNSVRVTIGLPDENKKFIEALGSVLKTCCSNAG